MLEQATRLVLLSGIPCLQRPFKDYLYLPNRRLLRRIEQYTHAVYAFVLWIVVAVVAMRYGKHLMRQSRQQRHMETAKTALE